MYFENIYEEMMEREIEEKDTDAVLPYETYIEIADLVRSSVETEALKKYIKNPFVNTISEYDDVSMDEIMNIMKDVIGDPEMYDNVYETVLVYAYTVIISVVDADEIEESSANDLRLFNRICNEVNYYFERNKYNL